MKLSHGKKTDAVIKPEASKAPTATTCKFKSGPRSRNINMEGISQQVIAFAKALLSALPPICFVVGTVLIIRGLNRFGRANSRGPRRQGRPLLYRHRHLHHERQPGDPAHRQHPREGRYQCAGHISYQGLSFIDCLMISVRYGFIQ